MALAIDAVLLKRSCTAESLPPGRTRYQTCLFPLLQDYVRMTFKSFHEVLRSQGEAIKALERTLEGKASRVEVSNVLHQKANSDDVTLRLRQVRKDSLHPAVQSA